MTKAIEMAIIESRNHTWSFWRWAKVLANRPKAIKAVAAELNAETRQWQWLHKKMALVRIFYNTYHQFSLPNCEWHCQWQIWTTRLSQNQHNWYRRSREVLASKLGKKWRSLCLWWLVVTWCQACSMHMVTFITWKLCRISDLLWHFLLKQEIHCARENAKRWDDKTNANSNARSGKT